MAIYVGAGHGGFAHGVLDVGAVANGTTEFAEVFSLYNKLVAIPNSGLQFIPAKMELVTRIAWINKNLNENDLYVEIHMNSAEPEAQGTALYYLAGHDDRRVHAESMLATYCASTGQNNRGAQMDTSTRFGRLGVIRDVRCQSYLLETGFITNITDLATVRTKSVPGILAMLGVQKPQPMLSDWAKDAWNKALAKGVVSSTTNPQEMIGNSTMEWLLKKTDLLDTVFQSGVSCERFIVVLDRLGKLNP